MVKFHSAGSLGQKKVHYAIPLIPVKHQQDLFPTVHCSLPSMYRLEGPLSKSRTRKQSGSFWGRWTVSSLDFVGGWLAACTSAPAKLPWKPGILLSTRTLLCEKWKKNSQKKHRKSCPYLSGPCYHEEKLHLKSVFRRTHLYSYYWHSVFNINDYHFYSRLTRLPHESTGNWKNI